MTHRQTHDNYDSLTNAQGEFQPSKPRDQPQQHSGHSIGTKVGNDAKPEFHAQTVPPGTASKSNLFQPNPISETPGQADNELAGRQHGKENTSTSAQDTLVGATSKDVHAGLGQPIAGQTHSDVDGKVSRSGGRLGTGGEGHDLNAADRNTRGGALRANDRDHLKSRDPAAPGVFSSKYAGAEEREPEGATRVARESGTSS